MSDANSLLVYAEFTKFIQNVRLRHVCMLQVVHVTSQWTRQCALFNAVPNVYLHN